MALLYTINLTGYVYVKATQLSRLKPAETPKHIILRKPSLQKLFKALI